MDISTFITWFTQQAIRIFSFTYSTLNSIEFVGTSLLKLIIYINVIIPFLAIIVTRSNNESERVRKREKRDKKNDK